MSHPRPDALLDMVEGTASPAVVAHVASCAACQAQIAGLDRALASAAAVDVPEPSPLFWDHLSARVREAVAVEPQPLSESWAARWWAWPSGVAVGAAVVLLASGFFFRAPSVTPPDTVAMAPASDDTGAPADAAPDASLALLADLASDLDWDGVAEVGWTMPAGTMDRVLVDLSAAERLELRRLLAAELNVSDQSL